MRILIGTIAVAIATAPTVQARGAAPFVLSSSAFRAGGPIPRTYTCDGRNVSPPLGWTAPPRAARSLALRVFDIDAGFVHWTAWRISTRSRSLGAAQRPPKQGRNDFGMTGYGGPCPPGGRHHYVFTLYALARPLSLASGAGAAEFSAALRTARMLAQAKLVGTYKHP